MYKLTFWNNLASHGGDIQYPDPLLLALVQGGLRDQLSGLEPELREGEKAVIFASRSRWVLPFDLTKEIQGASSIHQPNSRLKLALEWSPLDQGHHGHLLCPGVPLHLAAKLNSRCPKHSR